MCDPDGPDTCVSGWVCVRAEAGHKYKGVCTPAGDADVVTDPGTGEPGPLDPGASDHLTVEEGTAPVDPGSDDPGVEDPAGLDPAGEVDVAELAADLAEPTPDQPEPLPDVPEVGPDIPDVCVPSWNCSGWSTCTCANTQTQTCTDEHGCGTTTGKPAESQSCDHCGNGECDCGETNATCAGDCKCVANDHKACSAGNLYWYDSCGGQGSVAQTCTSGCTGAACNVSCPVDWVTIPGGTYQMGSTDFSSATPVHSVTVPGFKMARTEVTVCQYESCVTAGACTAPSSDCTQGADDEPVVCVDWDQSKAYCAWAGGRLCSEAEWEYAARNGSAGNKYPWGDTDPTCDDAVWSGNGCSASGPAAGCSKSAGNDKWGVCDLAGNVWEWVEDDYHSDYAGAPTDGSAWVDSPRASSRVERCGSFYDAYAVNLRSSYRLYAVPGDYYYYLGVRCCRSS